MERGGPHAGQGGRPGREAALLTPRPWTPGLQNGEEAELYGVSHRVCGASAGRPQQMNPRGELESGAEGSDDSATDSC